MKDIFLKKVIPIISVVVIIVSIFCFNVGAADYYNDVLSPSNCFTFTRSSYNGLVSSFSDASKNFTLNGVSFFYSSQDKGARPINLLSIMTNLGSGYKFKKGVSYHINFKFVFPSSYAPGGSVGSSWNANIKAGFYSWASPQINSNPDIAYLSCPQFSIYEGLIQTDINLPYFNVPSNLIDYDMSYIDLICDFVPTSDVVAKAFGITLSGDFVAWYGTVGLGDFFVSMPYAEKPLPGGTPDYNTNNTDNMHNLENSINNQNQANINAGNQLFSDFGNLLSGDGRLVTGIKGATYIFNHLFSNIGWANDLLRFSLTLGLIAFLLGSGVAIYNQGVNKGYRRERRQEAARKTEAYRQARLRRSKK